MNKFFSFLSGTICGLLVGSVTALLLAPSSGEEMLADANARIQNALEEGQRVRAETEQALYAEFEAKKQAGA